MFWRLYSSASNGIARFKHGDESWALVTGASDGIGKSLCKLLAQKGFNVVIHGRNQEKLWSVRDDLLQSYPDRKFEVIAADATRLSLVRSVVDSVAGKNITILINNAGYTGGPIQPLMTIDMEELERGINIGVLWTTQVTRALLPQLVENKPSLIVNIGSYVGSHPPPYLAVYTGTKGYLHSGFFTIPKA